MDGTATADLRSWRVEGMDCAGCVRKVEGAVARLPGVEAVEVSLMAERLRLRLGAGGATEDVERAVTALGYRISPEAPADDGASAPAATAADEGPLRALLRSAKAQLVATTAFLLAAAWGASLVLPPEQADWAFIAACLLGLAPVAARAFAALRARQPFTIEMLMTIAAAGALVIGAAAEAAMVVFLFAVGEFLEGVATDRARNGIRALAALVPKTARRIVDGALRDMPATALEIGDLVLVRPGERLPADGEIVEGESGVDESPVTGESVPVAKGPGSDVFASSIAVEGALTIRVTRAAEDNTIARIVRLVEEAEASRAPTERFIDRFSRIYMPAIVVSAILVAIVPPIALGADWGEWTYRALALLLIGCPCALVISVPAAMASSLSAGARRGLLMKGGAIVEAAARTTLVAFDKTGTLTEGAPALTDLRAFDIPEDELLALAAGVEQGSAHPLARAVEEAAAARGVRPRAATAAAALPGRGVRADIDGVEVIVGSPGHARERGALDIVTEAEIAALESQGKTVAVVLKDGAALGWLALRDEPRADARPGVDALRALGVRSIMLTGDNAATAAAIAESLGMESRAGMKPGDKSEAIRGLGAGDHVMMVGDGINDAPALAAASVGLSMGSGADVALETAHGALLRNRVTDVAALIRLARATMTNVRQNIAVALGLKAVFLVTTVLGVTGLWPAILADTGATVLVTLNALRLLRFDPEKTG
ncbi:MAG: heavy metal translocating P-type ATPase [Pikeienuella sp.]|uniref:heavy metal translocating P-type ATPase n=1 Tax=Pikeienuella sp. TaxID=2831957 RepID=UPI00391CF5E8